VPAIAGTTDPPVTVLRSPAGRAVIAKLVVVAWFVIKLPLDRKVEVAVAPNCAEFAEKMVVEA
jgi:hypothetical protein